MDVGEADAVAVDTSLGSVAAALKPLEHPSQVVRPDTYAFVSHRENGSILRAPNRDSHVTAIGAEFHGVAHQIVDHSLQPGTVPRTRDRGGGIHPDAVGRGQLLQPLRDPFGESDQVYGLS